MKKLDACVFLRQSVVTRPRSVWPPQSTGRIFQALLVAAVKPLRRGTGSDRDPSHTEKGGEEGRGRGGREGEGYRALHCHHQDDSIPH